MMKKNRNDRSRSFQEQDFVIEARRTLQGGGEGLSKIEMAVSRHNCTLKEVIDEVCDLQDDFDEDADPVRVYLFRKEDPKVPIYAAYARFYYTGRVHNAAA